ncbi:hypothetical protein N7G274_000445 [Stereocaulon virgatum]|uniref:Uncharacterized protein n=1 Tax=Stereocaulon virgatum TaxID=373712 RepID=A0ABR4AYG8_9LECA
MPFHLLTTPRSHAVQPFLSTREIWDCCMSAAFAKKVRHVSGSPILMEAGEAQLAQSGGSFLKLALISDTRANNFRIKASISPNISTRFQSSARSFTARVNAPGGRC